MAGGVEIGLALDGVYLAVDNHALAVEGDRIDIDVRLREALGFGAGVAGAAVAGGVGGGHVEAHGYFTLGNLEGLFGGRGLFAGYGVGRRGGGPVVNHDSGAAAGGEQAKAQHKRKSDGKRFLHFVFLLYSTYIYRLIPLDVRRLLG